MEKHLEESYQILDQLRLPHGLYLASPSKHYSYVWIRDTFYEVMPYLDKNCGRYEKTYHRLLDLFIEYEWKLDIHIIKKPQALHEFFHSRFHAESVTEITNSEWGHNQFDAIGAFLFGVAQGIKYGKEILRNQKDLEILQKVVRYLECCEYWNTPDNGMWEENLEIHSSSVGACVAGLTAISKLIYVSRETIDKGLMVLTGLYSAESISKPVDLAQMSLIYPYNLYGGVLAEKIVYNVEQRLLRQNGVIRYEGDSYYSTLEKNHGRNQYKNFYHGSEAEWTFGLPWLALCHMELGNYSTAKFYIDWTEDVMLEGSVLPELYYAKSKKHNPNTPLGWSSAMYILAKEKFLRDN